MTAKKQQKALSHGRPPLSRRRECMTSNQSRATIRNYHQLQKKRAAALKSGDTEAATSLALEIEKNGGIKRYQAASKQGQARDRGGDSSKVLVDWLQASQLIESEARASADSGTKRLKCLEIGALSLQNAISNYPNIVNMTRIDLNSQTLGIEKQDFMARPLPTNEDERFDIVSLSLVLNYVPDPIGRGEMLQRITKFLRTNNHKRDCSSSILPLLFLVLPLPCIQNSRYLDHASLAEVMGKLGFILRHSKFSSKIAYYAFSWTGPCETAASLKKKIKDGSGMNNFSIVVQ